MRHLFFIGSVIILILNAIISSIWPPVLWSMLVLGPVMVLGLFDAFQHKHAILRNFPVIGHFRYLLETIRPEMYQYFVESDTEGGPFSRDQRNVVYQRSKKVRDTVAFGTLRNVYEVGYEWVNHSLQPLQMEANNMRVSIGGPDCLLPYSCSILNISAMSYGSLSKNATLALNRGAKLGNFAHNTGEGGISPYHIQGGGDLIWQVGTGYFGCRNDEGGFDPDLYAKNATLPNVKMIELKLSQGAKPGHGGILPAAKVTPEIAEIRNVPMGQDVLSPPAHSAFSTPIEMMHFIAQLRDLSGGKPVGFKLCVGKRREFLAICKAMIETGISPDFISIDGGEGGTGAAPLEFTNHVGSPLIEGLIFVHNALIGFGLRDKIKILSSGKITTGFAMVKRLALGADICYSARGMMMALGCIQALKCNTNHCPVGVATQDPSLMAGLVVTDKTQRVANLHEAMLKSACEMIGAMGIEQPQDLRPWHIMRRTSPTHVLNYGEVYEFLESGDLLKEKDQLPDSYRRAVEASSSESFDHVTDLVH
jgi:hypothetical protein